MLALVYLHAQSKPDAVGDVQPVEGLTAKLGQTPVVLPFDSIITIQWYDAADWVIATAVGLHKAVKNWLVQQKSL